MTQPILDTDIGAKVKITHALDGKVEYLWGFVQEIETIDSGKIAKIVTMDNSRLITISSKDADPEYTYSVINSSSSVDVMTNAEFDYNGDNVSLLKTFINLGSESTSTESELVQLANSTTAGVMSPASVQAIQSLTDKVNALEGIIVRLLYTDSTAPTAAQIEAFVVAKGYSDLTKWAGIAVVVAGSYHVWHYYVHEGWRDDGEDTVSQFTNNTPGVIKGSELKGQIYAEDNGTGSVVGWDLLENDVNTAASDISWLTGVAVTVDNHLNVDEGKTQTNNSFGQDTIVSHAEGEELSVAGAYNHAEGYKSSVDKTKDYTGLDVYSDESDKSYCSHAEGNATVCKSSNSHAEGKLTVTEGDCSHAEGYSTEASGERSHAEGGNTSALGRSAHAEGGSTIAEGNYTHAEGYLTKASGEFAHAEGYNEGSAGGGASGTASHSEGYCTTASGSYSHAEGNESTAVGHNSHAEGYNTQANGEFSHAEGYESIANGQYSHAAGIRTVASKDSQYVRGKFNAIDALPTNQFVDIVGWGADEDHRANLYALDASGNLHLSGDVYEGCDADSTGGTRLYDKYVKIQQPASDIGKTLVVGNNGRVICQAIRQLPAVTAADAGKILMVDTNGKWVVASLPITRENASGSN